MVIIFLESYQDPIMCKLGVTHSAHKSVHKKILNVVIRLVVVF
jgi:hypothetical protein